MSYRQSSLTSSLAARVGRLSQRCVSFVEQSRITATAGLQAASTDAGRASDAEPSRDETRTALVDPDDGPTSRDELLEYGFTPEEYARAVLE